MQNKHCYVKIYVLIRNKNLKYSINIKNIKNICSMTLHIYILSHRKRTYLKIKLIFSYQKNIVFENWNY